MRAVYLYVTGRMSATPSVARGYRALAHDAVCWWDAHVHKTARISQFMQCRAHMITALRGDPGPFRPLRPSHRRGTCEAFDDIRSILLSPASASTRMRMVEKRLHCYRRRALIAAPVLDAPARLFASVPDADASQTESVVDITAERSAASAQFAGALRDVEARSRHAKVDVVVFFDATQRRYVEEIAGTDLATMWPGAARMCLREFLAKEKLAPTMPLAAMARRVVSEPSVADVANLASVVAHLAHAYHAIDIVAAMRVVCGITASEAIERGVAFRCARMVQARAGVVPRPPGVAQPVAVEGGEVLEPSRSFVGQAIAVVDFASLYPSIIAATGVGDAHALPSIVRDLMRERRAAANDVLARAYKVAANSVYGQLASPVSALYDPAAANAITAAGRARLQSLVAHLTADGGEVIYGDTDSCMVSFKPHRDVAACKAEAARSVATFNATLPSPMRVEVQEVFERGVFLAKKKYIGVTAGGMLKCTGTLNVRADTPPALRDAYETLANQVLVGFGGGECSAASVTDAIARAHKRLLAEPKARCSAIKKLTSLEKAADPIPGHIELARRENFREEGAYTPTDAIVFAPCVPLPSERWRTRGDVVCEAELDGADRAVQHAALWTAFANAATGLVAGAMGSDMGRVCADKCQTLAGQSLAA